ncbi:MAG: hypothetical protein WC845_00310 [Candidatus Staskawiczbacteria bacterium]|jgi:hypothetical protein
MSKNIYSLSAFIIFFTVLVIIPITKVEATSVFVGLQLDTARKISDGSSFCLPVGTIMYVMEGSVPLNSVTLTSTVCENDGDGDLDEHKIFSNLVSLTIGNEYKVRLEASLCPCYLRYNSVSGANQCWCGGHTPGAIKGLGESCSDACSAHGLIPEDYGVNHSDENADALKNQTGTTCSGTNNVASCLNFGGGGGDFPVVSNAGKCWRCETNHATYNTGWERGDYAVVCPCKFNSLNFDFVFVVS